ncbi:membrane-bound acylglycerophosphatidylinositol O-acyltransferase mboat7-like [Clavelina lepadiformis]|uniref:Leukocyte receptor cluster member 4 n=1 Tax=Clavelina lepadiformis TaxID=159417 RepID=A0ABP0GWD0_CLALP
MVSNDIIYGSVLLLSILVGLPLRNLTSSKVKQLVTAGIGLAIALPLCQCDILHSIVTFVGNILIIKFSRRYTAILSFAWCFLYLLFFRCCTFFMLPKPSPLANAIQLLLTLKLVSVAIEISDLRRAKAGKVNKIEGKFQLQLEYEPTVLDMFCFTYCYAGLFTGPFFKYRTYYDYLKMDRSSLDQVPWKNEILSRLKQIAICAILFIAASYIVDVNYPKNDEFYSRPLWYRIWYMVPVFFIGRMRFYSAWLLAECAFVTLSLGAYPRLSAPRPGHGPTVKTEDNKDYVFETIRNIDPYNCDFSPTVRLGMRHWNMGVQWWLANYVHKRWPASLKGCRVAAVMAVSAFWHGIDPGFFAAFLTMPFVMAAEDLLASLIKKQISSELHNAYDWCNWFAKMRSFEYMYMAFALLTLDDTYRYWRSTYFWLHFISFFLIVSCLIVKNALSLLRRNSKPMKGKSD